jgi:predicted dehydrogenase
MKPKINVCLIGFGNVGQGLYLKTEAQNSHLSLIQSNNKLDLVAIIDPEIESMSLNIPGVRIAKTIAEVRELQVDLAVVACPTSTHLKTCSEIVQYLRPDAILLEKPVGLNLSECQEIRDQLTEIPLVLVNYQRNYNEIMHQQVTEMVNSGCKKGVVYYSNGALNNASHGLALLVSVLGRPTNVFRSPNIIDRNLSDMSWDFVVEFGELRMFLIATEEKDYSMFRIELYGSEGSWVYDAGLERSEMRSRIEDPVYLGRFSLTQNSIITSIPETESFTHVYNYLEKRLRGELETSANVGAGLDLALEVHEIIEKARK